jgi:hypothetical protein
MLKGCLCFWYIGIESDSSVVRLFLLPKGVLDFPVENPLLNFFKKYGLLAPDVLVT